MSEETQTAERPTNLVDLLDQLVLPPEPEPVSLLPQTFGWVVLGLVLLCGLAFLALRWRARVQRNAYRKEALLSLDRAGQDAAAIAEVLRRCALAAYPRADVAGLTGDAWLAFLDKTAGETGFSNGPGRVLATAPYTTSDHVETAVLRLARHWVRAHKPEGAG